MLGAANGAAYTSLGYNYNLVGTTATTHMNLNDPTLLGTNLRTSFACDTGTNAKTDAACSGDEVCAALLVNDKAAGTGSTFACTGGL